MSQQPETAEQADNVEWSLATSTLPRDELQVQLEVYSQTILLRIFDKTTWVKTVSADEIAKVFVEHLGFSSGLLPADALWWCQSDIGEVVALWRPPAVWSVSLQREPFKPPDRFELPMPGLVFVCSSGRPPWVYAAVKRPQSPDDNLYRMPTFNVFRDGRACAGSHNFPDDLNEIPESFFLSYFSKTGDQSNRSQKYPDDLLSLWDELNGTKEYPLDDLVAQCTVRHAIAVSEGKDVH